MKHALHRLIYVCCTALVAATLPLAAGADTCDAGHANALARQGYQDLDRHQWSEAKTVAGELIQIGQDCESTDVRIAAAVHSAYIGSAALHGLGDDARASEGVKAGLMLLDMLQKSGEYKSLYDAMQPRFIELQRQLKS